MTARAIAVFFGSLALIRNGERRAFGQRSPFDYVVAILLGATLSRVIVGASPAVATAAASLTIVLIHRALERACVRFPRLERLLVGEEREDALGQRGRRGGGDCTAWRIQKEFERQRASNQQGTVRTVASKVRRPFAPRTVRCLDAPINVFDRRHDERLIVTRNDSERFALSVLHGNVRTDTFIARSSMTTFAPCRNNPSTRPAWKTSRPPMIEQYGLIESSRRLKTMRTSKRAVPSRPSIRRVISAHGSRPALPLLCDSTS